MFISISPRMKEGNAQPTKASEISLEAYRPITEMGKVTVTLPPPVLAGTASDDGGGVSEVYAWLDTPEGESYWYVAERDGAVWSYTPRVETAGLYTLQVEALDQAGNIQSVGPFDLLVVSGWVYPPLVMRDR